MRKATHQLVIQFPQSAFTEFAELMRYEARLEDMLNGPHDVDGHDIGSDEVNFFVLTSDPTSVLGSLREAGGSLLSHPEVRVAARLVNAEDYVPLWPFGDQRDFTIA